MQVCRLLPGTYGRSSTSGGDAITIEMKQRDGLIEDLGSMMIERGELE